jgi:peptide chain release factor subunit 1
LKRYKTIPTNGIALFAGVQPIVAATDGAQGSNVSSATSGTAPERDRLMVRDIEPLKPLRTGMYYCDGKFHVDALLAQLNDDIVYGFVILDGGGCHMYLVSGDSYNLVWKHGDPALPKKHGRGGQSAPRFGRLRQIARAAWISIVAKQLNVVFTDKSTGNVNVAGIVLCGSGELKQQLALRGNVLDDRISKAVLPTLVDLQYGGHAGIQEAIKKAAPLINDHSFSRQRGVVVSFMEGLVNDTGLIAYGPVDTMHALHNGAVATLLVSETLAYRRVHYRHAHSQESCFEYIDESSPIPSLPAHVRAAHQRDEDVASPSAPNDPHAPSFMEDAIDQLEIHPRSTVTGGESDTEWRIESVEPLLDYLVAQVPQLGASVQLVSPASTQGAQFKSAFGGIGAILRYPISLPSAEIDEILDEDSDGGYDFDF